MSDEMRAMSFRSKKLPVEKRATITRAALELAIAEAIKTGSPECSGLIAVVVEQIFPAKPGGINWAVKGMKFGKADRAQCAAALSRLLEGGQFDFEVAD